MTAADAANLYVHFPFCRRKCRYCALLSRVGRCAEDRSRHVELVVRALAESVGRDHVFKTVYFGGGTPALCALEPLLEALAPHLDGNTEFTVELHPLDVSRDLLATLGAGGVNRISMGLQSVDDGILRDMNRGYDFATAERAFAAIRERFDNAGVDLIVGYPGETTALLPRHARLAKWGLRHCSAYALILEEKSVLGHAAAAGRVGNLPSDDVTLDRLAVMRRFLQDIGLFRYEISNYAAPGFECRHNLAVWRGEDYLGLGEGACGRLGLTRTRQIRRLSPADGCRGPHPSFDYLFERETLSPAEDRKERELFRLRTREGLDAEAGSPREATLMHFEQKGLVRHEDTRFFLTERGAEVCDAILAELV